MERSRDANIASRCRLLLLRHGETTYNATGRMQGQLDTELSDVGRAQAAAAAEYFAAKEPGLTRIISSDLMRAHDTAKAIGETCGIDVSVDKRLRETYLGTWQERSFEELDTEFPGARDLWRHSATWAPPGAESRVEVGARMRAVVDELAADPAWDDETFMIVSHGGAIAALMASLLDLPEELYTTFNGVRNTAWAELQQRTRPTGETRWYINAFNSQAYKLDDSQE